MQTPLQAGWPLFLIGLLLGAVGVWMLRGQASKRQTAEALAREMMAQLDRMALVVRRTSNAVIITNAQRRITWVNEGFERVTGYVASEAIGRTPAELLQFDGTDAQTIVRMREALNAGQGFHGELLNRGKHGRRYWLAIEIQPLHDSEGRLSGFMAIQSDISERRNTEVELRASQAFLHNTGRVAGVGGWEYDLLTHHLACSEQARLVLGFDAGQEPTLDECLALLDAAARDLVQQAIAGGFAEAMAWDHELRARTADGRDIWVRVVAEGLFADDGATRIVGAIQDVTALVQATQAAQAANLAKSEFLANISHELRTPLQSVIGFSELGLHKAAPQPGLQRMFGEINAGGGRMLKLVNALLEVAHMDTPSAALQGQPCDWAELAQAVVDERAADAQQREVRVTCPQPWPALPVHGDPQRLSQALHHVLDNALRYSPPGGLVELRVVDQGDQGLTLRVRDQGPGVPDDERERVFDAFVLGSRTRDGSGGTGLGLTLARKIMSVHGGRIHLESPAEGGTEAVLWLPPRPATRVPAASAASSETEPEEAPREKTAAVALSD